MIIYYMESLAVAGLTTDNIRSVLVALVLDPDEEPLLEGSSNANIFMMDAASTTAYNIYHITRHPIVKVRISVFFFFLVLSFFTNRTIC